jgi:translation initiation factor IF-2
LAKIEKAFVDDPKDISTRSPIVTVLGHVDHGKTSLLDAIRTSNVAAKEHGGITQHIGASLVKVGDRSVVFLDTPGHKAFTEMRARGAQVTDVVVLVVAADDGVMPQTKEAIAHARAAKVPIVVAMNKCDLPQANPQRVFQELTNEGLQPEEWGGDTGVYQVSALTKKGIPELLERLALESDVLELKANPKRSAVGTCLEAEQSRGEGNAARILIQNGTLKKGDIFVCGVAYRARARDQG